MWTGNNDGHSQTRFAQDPENFLDNGVFCWTLPWDTTAFVFWTLFVTNPLIPLLKFPNLHNENEGLESYPGNNSLFPLLSLQAILEWGCNSDGHNMSALNFLVNQRAGLCAGSVGLLPTTYVWRISLSPILYILHPHKEMLLGASWHWISGSNTWHFMNSSSVRTSTWHSGVFRMSCFFKRDCLTSEEELALLLILKDWNWDSPNFLLPLFSCSTLMNCNQTPSGIRDQRDQKGQLIEQEPPLAPGILLNWLLYGRCSHFSLCV